MTDKPSSHQRTMNSPAWWGIIAVLAVLAAADTELPTLPAWTLNTAVILGAAYLTAWHKKVRLAWVAFWVMAAVCAADGVCLLLPVVSFSDPASFASQIVLWIAAGAVYCLVRAQKPTPVQVPVPQQIIHHHVMHLPDGTVRELPAMPAQRTVVTATVERPAINA